MLQLQCRRNVCVAALVAMLLACTCVALAQRVSKADQQNIFWYTAPLPLGADGFQLLPARKTFYLLASVEDSDFDRLQVSRVRESKFVIDAAGDVWKHYPDELTFRVTATALQTDLTGLDMDTLNESVSLEDLLLGLKFRLKAYRGLNVQILTPKSVKLIGVPADVNYDERIYRVKFDTEEMPLDTRLVLEILSPDGQLLSRMHLELL